MQQPQLSPTPDTREKKARRFVADELSAVRPAAEWVDTILADMAVGEDTKHDLQVCLEEVLANLIRHGRARAGGKSITLEVLPSDEAVTLIVRDRCVPFDVTDETLFEAKAPEEARIGGHGLRLLHALASELTYRAGASGNELRMTFRSGARTADLDAENDVIRKIPAFAQVPDAALTALRQSCLPIAFQAGESLLEQGGASDYALILLSGDAAVFNRSQHGDAPLAHISAPALVGEIGALAGSRRTASVRAVGDVRALRVERDVLLKAGRHAPDLLVSVVGQLGQQIQNINAALGLYAAGFAALERDDFEPTVLNELNNPTEELRSFAEAFRGLAKRVMLERRTRSEMASAALIQAAMLPAPLEPAALAGRCDAFGAMKPARDVGGDLFDLFLLDDNRLAMVVADVCGKGVPAALFMCATVTALRLAAQRHADLSSVVSEANGALCAQNAMSMFSTLFYGVLDLSTGRLEYVNCGHNPPLLLARDGACAELPGGGPPLGLFAEHQWTSNVMQLDSGEGVFLFTDGVTECADPGGEEYGDARLAALLRERRGLSAADLVNIVIADALRFTGEAEQFDDITCVAALLP